MIRHAVQDCAERCYPRCAQICELCTSQEPIFAFDINNMQTCPRCGRVYPPPHRRGVEGPGCNGESAHGHTVPSATLDSTVARVMGDEAEHILL